MKHTWIVISLSVVFFLTALTFYANRVIFPTVIKKIAIEQAEAFLKRKVEIESLRFNWLRGVIINNIKVFQKDSSQEVFVQAEKVSIGIIFIPGFKQHKIILPFVNIDSPSLHVIHRNDNTWNFSDLLTPPAAGDIPSPVEVTLSGIHITNGKARLDTIGPQGLLSERLDQINLSIGLSLSGISFNGSINIPQKQGSLSVNGAYQPLNQTLKTSLILKNIKPLDYLALVPVTLPITLTSGTIQEINATIDYAPEKINVDGKWLIKDLDLTYANQNIKTDFEVSGAHISLHKNAVALKGLYTLTNTQITSPAFFVKGHLQADVTDFLMNSPEDISMKGSLNADALSITLPTHQTIEGQLKATITQAHLQKDTAALEGSLDFHQAVIILSDEQTIKGDFKLSDIKLSKDKSATIAHTDLVFNNLDIRLPGQIFKGNLNSHNLSIHLNNPNNLKANGPLELTNFQVVNGPNNIKGDLLLKTFKVSFDEASQSIDAQAQGKLQNTLVTLDKQGTLTTQAHFDLHTIYPLKKPEQLTYNGSISLADARFEGLPFGPLKEINLTADFKTDSLTIQHLSLIALETALKASGSITQFTKPFINVHIESERFDLSKIKTAAPDLLKPYGLTVTGETSFKLKFQGLAADPLNGQFDALAILQHVNVTSSTLKQEFKNISATLNANGNSLSWEDFTATLMDHPLSSSGQLTNFKNPNINTSLSWNGLDLKTQITKTNHLITIKDISGQYLTVPFSAHGTVDLTNKEPSLNIESNVKLKLEDLVTLVPTLKTNLEPLKLNGELDTSSSIKGTGLDWKTWTILAESQSDLISIAGFKFNTVQIDLSQANGKINKFNIKSKLYDGDLNIVTTADLIDLDIPFQTALHVENVNLSKLKNDTGAKDEDLRGFIALTSMVNGNLKEVLQITGKGALNISQGYLMKKEFSSLFMIPELSNLSFTEATANFDIANQIVSTENFVLKSEGALLNGKGTIGFDQRIQFELHPEFNIDTISQSESMRKGPSALIASAASKYLTFTVTGTLAKPEIRTIKRPGELIKKTGELIKENVGQILQGLFQ